MKHHLARLAAGILLVFAVLTAPAFATSVTMRVEGNTPGAQRTVNVNTTGAGVPGNSSCVPNSAGEALEIATAGNWDRSAFASTILGESHTYSASDYWAFWINGSYSQTQGICDYVVQPGDEILLYPQVDNASFMGTVWPLYFTSVPSSVVAGQSYTVSVIQRVADFSSTTSQPASGATVSDGTTTVTTDANGQATLTAPSSGPVQLVATQAAHVKSPTTSIAVTAPAPSAPTTAPSETPAPTPTPAGTPLIPGQPTAATDTQAPVTSLAGLRNRQRFAQGKGPRELKGSVTDSGAIKTVELRLRRQSGKRCAAFSAKAEKFTQISCKRDAAWFSVGSTADWSYLLPSKLSSGLYQLQVRATDAAGNQSTVQSLRFRVA